MGFGVWGLEFGVPVLGSGVWGVGLGFGVWGLESGDWGLEFGVFDLDVGVGDQNWGFRACGLRVESVSLPPGFRIQDQYSILNGLICMSWIQVLGLMVHG